MIDFKDLEVIPGEEFASNPHKEIRKQKERPTFPCMSCAGTGKYLNPRVHREKAHCFSCGGRGFFYQSEADRFKKREGRKARKQNALEIKQAAMLEQHPDLRELLAAIAWSNMGASFNEQFSTKGTLSDRQVDVARSILAKSIERDKVRNAEREAERAARTVEVDLSPIQKMFETARSKGLNKMAYRAANVKMTPAKSTGKNPGAIYVKRIEDGQYLGKVFEGKFLSVRECTPADREAVLEIARDPFNAARLYGQRTGNCSCCGRELTNKASIDLGIGPICAEKWGFIAAPVEIEKPAKEKVEGESVKAKPTKYEYPEGMTDDEKRKYRARMRKEKRG